MADFIYRFRSTDALLGSRAELEKQEIYTSPKQLNDPLEGYKDLFWKGDVIVWKNFLRHYVLCLMQAVLLALGHGEEYEITEDNLPFRMIDDDLQPEVRKLYDAMCEKMFCDAELAPLPDPPGAARPTDSPQRTVVPALAHSFSTIQVGMHHSSTGRAVPSSRRGLSGTR